MIINHKEFQIQVHEKGKFVRVKKMNKEIAYYSFNFDYVIIDHPYIFLYDDKQKVSILMEDEGIVFDIFDLEGNIKEELGYMFFKDY